MPRVFSTIADFLAEMAQNKGGLRSGPAHNPDWDTPMESLRSGRVAEAVQMMAAFGDTFSRKLRLAALLSP